MEGAAAKVWFIKGKKKKQFSQRLRELIAVTAQEQDSAGKTHACHIGWL